MQPVSPTGERAISRDMILRDPHGLVSRRSALTMTDVVAMLVVFVAIVAILF